jgi:guanylate kinase
MEKADFIKWVRKLESEYVHSASTKQRLSQVDLLAIVGPTGVGKTTIIQALGIPEVVSDVTRPMRPGEKDGKHYHFRSDYLQIIEDIKNGEYVQFLVSEYGEFYGTRASVYPEVGGCVMAVVAQKMPQFRTLGFRSVTGIYVMPPSYVEWMRRIGGVRAAELGGRIDEARASILLAQEEAGQYHFILNDVLDLAVKDIRSILAGQTVDEHRSQLAYDTADVILERIGDGN